MKLNAVIMLVEHIVLRRIEHAAKLLMMSQKKIGCQYTHSLNQRKRAKKARNPLLKHQKVKMERKRRAHIKSHHYQANKDGTHKPMLVRNQVMPPNAAIANVVPTVLHQIEHVAKLPTKFL